MIATQAHLIHKHDSPSGMVSYIIFQVEEHFDFLEGQFVMIQTEIHGKVIKKPYSIATTNEMMKKQKHLGIVVKKTSDGGMSDFLTQELSLGQTITIKGPVGHYTDPQQNQNYLLISVGSGLSPNVSHFVRLVYETQRYNRLVNIFGERYYAHILPEIEALFIDHGQTNVHNLFYLSQEKDIPLGYQHGHVQDGLRGAIDLLGTHLTAFVCGKPEMVTDVQAQLMSLGVAKDQILFEKY